MNLHFKSNVINFTLFSSLILYKATVQYSKAVEDLIMRTNKFVTFFSDPPVCINPPREITLFVLFN